MPVPIQKSLSHSKPSLSETSLTPEMFLGIIDYLWVLSNSEYFMILYIDCVFGVVLCGARDLDLMTPVSPFQLRLLYDSMVLSSVILALSVSLQRGLQVC